MGFPEKLIELQYFVKVSSRDSLYDFCGLPLEKRASRGKTTKSRFKTDDLFIESRVQEKDEDQHILLGKRSGKDNKAHMIIDGKTGEQRVEDGRGEPTDTAQHIETIINWLENDATVSVDYADETEAIFLTIINKHASEIAPLLKAGKKVYTAKKLRKDTLKKIVSNI